MNKFTPGPWKATFIGDACWDITSDREFVGVVRGGNAETDRANARLIAAVPDLLLACQRAAGEDKYIGDECPLCEGIRLSDEVVEHGPYCLFVVVKRALDRAIE